MRQRQLISPFMSLVIHAVLNLIRPVGCALQIAAGELNPDSQGVEIFFEFTGKRTVSEGGFQLLHDLQCAWIIAFCQQHTDQGGKAKTIRHDVLPGFVAFQTLPNILLSLVQAVPFVCHLSQINFHAAGSINKTDASFLDGSRYLDPIKERGIRFVYTSGSVKMALGEAAYEWNRLEEAQEYIREGLKGNEPWQNIMTDGFGLTALVRVLLAKDDYSGALQIVEQLEAKFHNRALPRETRRRLPHFESAYSARKRRSAQRRPHGRSLIQHSTDYETHNSEISTHTSAYCINSTKI